MAERLNSLINDQELGNVTQPLGFNPRSVAVQIRTPEELAAVNEFLVTLGQDVSAGSRSQRDSQNQVLSDDFFDPISLSQLGLTGMPGVLGSNNYSGNSYSTDVPHYPANNSYSMARSNSLSVATNQYSAYDATSHPASSYQTSNDYALHQNRRPTKPYVQTPHSSYSSRYHHPPPSLETSSPLSTASTPGAITPPHPAMSENIATFDYLRPPRGPTPVAHLAPIDYMTKTMRQVVPLRSAPGEALGRPEPVEPKLTQPVHRGPPARLTSLSSTTSSSIYPSLEMELDQYKLAPLNYRSSSPASRESTPSSTHSSPLSQHTVLPSLRSIASPVIGRSVVSEDLAKDVDKIEIGNHEISLKERRRHAALLRDMLVTINQEYQKQHGIVPKLTEYQPESPSSRDVEMNSA